MNIQQQVFFSQAESDWEVYLLLRGQTPRIACQELHYLQMATEKLAKSYLWGTKTPPGRSHASFTQFLRIIADKTTVRTALRLTRQVHLRVWIKTTLPLCRSIEMLAPKLAGDGPNPEYPWPPDLPDMAPVLYDFTVWRDLDTGRGRKLIRLISSLFDTFPNWA